MTKESSSRKIQSYIAKAAQANTKALLLQTKFFEDLVTLNGSAFNELADRGVNNLQQLSEAKSFIEALENSLSTGVAVRDKVQSLFRDSTRALEDLQDELRDVYICDSSMFEHAREFTEESLASARKVTDAILTPGEIPD